MAKSQNPELYWVRMTSSPDVLTIVQSLAKGSRTAHVSFGALAACAAKQLIAVPGIDAPSESSGDAPLPDVLSSSLIELERSGHVKLTFENGAITTVTYPPFYADGLRELYEQLEQQPDRPFPGDEALSGSIPAEHVQTVEVRTSFIEWLTRPASTDGPEILKLTFPDGVLPVVVTPTMLAGVLPKLAVQKVRRYLRNERNAGYMRSKLASVFRDREVAMKDMLNAILATPDQALKTIFRPTDFTFHFWTQLASTLIKEYSGKRDKLSEEHGHCQAAYLIGYYSVHLRGVQQRARERDSALKELEHRLRKQPYAFTIGDIHNFADRRGVLLTRKYSLEDLNTYIADNLRSDGSRELPPMIRIRCEDGTEYYIYREYVHLTVVERLFDARRKMRDHYLQAWQLALKQNTRPAEMTEDDVFARSVESRLRTNDPVLLTLLDYRILALARRETRIPDEPAADLNAIFDPDGTRLRPLAEILNLDREKIATEARLLVPFWQAVPMISVVVTFLRRVLIGPTAEKRAARRSGRSARRSTPRTAIIAVGAPSSGRPGSLDTAPDRSAGAGLGSSGRRGTPSASRKEEMRRFKAAARDLGREYVLPGSTPERTLDELAERWNPLLDSVAKEHLVEDINSLARDFLRRMKVSFRLIPPTKERVDEWADRLCRNEAFAQIRREDDLRMYLKLYMLTLLGK